jgi:L-asparaginase
MSKPSILLIYTGGTIGMMREPETGVLRPFELGRLLETVPELKGFHIALTTESFEQPIDSSDMHPQEWIFLATLVQKHYNDYDGFVILHGSDTMAYTASALSFMLDGLKKPVVLTGSQLPIGQVRTDGRENLAGAIEIAALSKNGRAEIPEVCIFFGGLLLRGNRAVKRSTEDLEAFYSPNFEPLARAGVHWHIQHNNIWTSRATNLKVSKQLDASIGVVHLFPGLQRTAVTPLMDAGLRAIVLRTFGSGNAFTDPWFLDIIARAVADGKVVVNISQCFSGGVVQGKYATSVGLQKAGVLSGGDMTFEAAVAKLMVLLGNSKNAGDIADQFMKNLKGERTL